MLQYLTKYISQNHTIQCSWGKTPVNTVLIPSCLGASRRQKKPQKQLQRGCSWSLSPTVPAQESHPTARSPDDAWAGAVTVLNASLTTGLELKAQGSPLGDLSPNAVIDLQWCWVASGWWPAADKAFRNLPFGG